MKRTALVVHAHPDDEVFATGAATIALAEAGWRVVLRVATTGLGATPEGACELLGIQDWDWLAEPDRWIDDAAAAGPKSLAAAGPRQVSQEISRTFQHIRPDLVLTVGSDGLTGHPDHVVIDNAVRLALRDFSCPSLGARLPAADVQAGHWLLRRLLPQEPIGSGRVIGCPPGTPLRTYAGGPATAERRQRALDHYSPGLGTLALEELLTTYERRGDSLLLRAVFDAVGWHRDRFETLQVLV